MKKIISLFFILLSFSAWTQTACQFDSCYSLSEAMDKAGKLSFESQEGLLELFQTRQEVKVRTGQLLPSFNLRISNPSNVFDYIPNLVGFLFPSNWFHQKESKLHALAQRHSYASLVGNQKSSAAALYFTAHQETLNLQTLDHSLVSAHKFLTLIQSRYDQGDVASEDVEEVKTFINRLETEKIIQNSYLRELTSELALLINRNDQFENSGPEVLTLPDLSQQKPIDPRLFEADVMKVSPELKSLSYLEMASQYARKARKWDFLTPESGTENAFGFGYFANLSIAQAEIEKVKIKQKAFTANLKKTLVKVSSQINSSLQIYQLAISTGTSLDYILQAMTDDFQVNSKIDINRFIMIMSESLSNRQMKTMAEHNFVRGQLLLERLLFKTSIYQEIYQNMPASNETSMECYQRKENRSINADIQSGALVLPEKIEFDKDDLRFCL